MPQKNEPGAEGKRLLRSLPSMQAILDAFTAENAPALCVNLAAALPRPLLREAVESCLEQCRAAILQGRIRTAGELALPVLLPRLAEHAAAVSAPHFRRMINATGVIVHTNLGRSLLAEEAVKAVAEAGRHWSNLEFDLATAKRGSRHSHVEGLICRLTGAEAALAVNNNAAAVLLVLDTLCKGREVVVSRGELVEIGGSFRIPAIMEKSGCILREVGSTNRTHLADYTEAINENTAALMKVHTSNYRIIGFTKEVSRTEMAEAAKKNNVALLEDLGGGLLLPFGGNGLRRLSGEPAVPQVLKEGVDVVTFSGDKVLGGPQAGIIVGRKALIERMKNNQLARALRIDKLTLAALEATLRLYLDPELAEKHIPTLRMIRMEYAELQKSARALAGFLKRRLAAAGAGASAMTGVSVGLCDGTSRVGGGAFPEQSLPTCLVGIVAEGVSPNDLQRALLTAKLPLLARIERDAVCFDPRTLTREEFPAVADALRHALDVCRV